MNAVELHHRVAYAEATDPFLVWLDRRLRDELADAPVFTRRAAWHHRAHHVRNRSRAGADSVLATGRA